MQLFRYHEDKLRTFGLDALQRYYDLVANPTKPITTRISFTRLATA